MNLVRALETPYKLYRPVFQKSNDNEKRYIFTSILNEFFILDVNYQNQITRINMIKSSSPWYNEWMKLQYEPIEEKLYLSLDSMILHDMEFIDHHEILT